jgi:hypothetical protein
MTEYLLLISTNLIFQSSRTYNTRAIANGDTVTVIWSSFIVKFTWMVSTSIGVKSIFEGDLYLASTYLLTGVLGDYIGMKLKYNGEINE